MAGYAMLNADGSVRIGRVCPDIPGNQLIVDICHTSWGESPTCVLAEDGTWLGRIISDRSRRHQTIDWDSSGIDSFIISQTCAIFDGSGKKTAVFDIPWNGRKIIIQSYKGDMTGDGIPDLIFHTVPAKEVYIFKNEKGGKVPGIHLGTKKNFTP
ncbi:MAG: hypothetical protein PF904_21115 [Kiritimatiellae bacterium]|jgi:hypothetical protein|nr:hypothetical protein [Kiritimatiellia bacterium]